MVAAAASLGFARVAAAPSVDAADALSESAGMSRADATVARGPAALPSEAGHRLSAARGGTGGGDHDCQHGHLLAQAMGLDVGVDRSRQRLRVEADTNIVTRVFQHPLEVGRRAADRECLVPGGAADHLAGLEVEQQLDHSIVRGAERHLDIGPAQVDGQPVVRHGRTTRQRQA